MASNDNPTPTAVIEWSTAASQSTDQVLQLSASSPMGLTDLEATHRRAEVGDNVIAVHKVRARAVLLRQLRSALLGLLVVTAAISFAVGDRIDAVIIMAILIVSVAIGFFNEYRAEAAASALHTQIRHEVVVRRDEHWQSRDVVELVPGDIVRLSLGEIVPADLRLLESDDLECDESILTGEAQAAVKSATPASVGSTLGDVPSCCFMGTVVLAGSGEGVVLSTGIHTEFGQIATDLTTLSEETEFQAGLRKFSVLLVQIAVSLTTGILVINLLLHRPILESILFSLAIAVGITPQLLPAIVATSLATGSRRLAKKRVLVKRLVCIEDLGDIEILITDKTGTLTEGKITYERSIDTTGTSSDAVRDLGLACSDVTLESGVPVGGSQLDVALWQAVGTSASLVAAPSDVVPFDHVRRIMSVLVGGTNGTVMISKGAPESVLELCVNVSEQARRQLDEEFAAGRRVVALASKSMPAGSSISVADERGLSLQGFITFLDQPKEGAAASLLRLASLGVVVKVATGDNAVVAQKVCDELGLPSLGTLTGDDIGSLSDEELATRVTSASIFARVSPEQKARLIRAHRGAGRDVAFLGDGVNDAVALHAADVGISVESATDVAKDAADIVLLDKDLEVLADGVEEGRRTFENTIKYILMGTSSNFGNMFSAAVASAFLSFLPMLPSQILLNNLLYDSSQMSIPTDHVDVESVARPVHWDIRMIRRFMMVFGPISSLFDFATFALMLWFFHAGPALFRSGWFIESLATQTLVVFVIRTRRSPFWRSRPSWPLVVSVFSVIAVGIFIIYSPFADALGFATLPADFFAVLFVMVLVYIALVEYAKSRFFRSIERQAPAPAPTAAAHHERRIKRRARRWVRYRPAPTRLRSSRLTPAAPGAFGAAAK